MKEATAEGRDVQSAVENGIQKLGLRRDQVEVAILDEGSPGFLGLGARPAKVKLTEKRWEGEGQPPSAMVTRPPKPAQEERPSAPREERRPRNEQRNEPRRERAPRQEPRREARPASPAVSEPRVEIPVDTGAAVKTAESVVGELLGLSGIAGAKVSGQWDDKQSRVDVQAETSEAPLLVGNDGRTLEALQFLATVVVSRKIGSPVAVHVDSGGYSKSKEEKLLAQVLEAADRVKKSGRPFRMEPMDPPLRRLVHKALADNPDVETASEGEGPWRKVVLKPRRK